MSIPRAPRGLPRGAEPGRGWGWAVLREGRAGPTGLQSAAVVGVPSPRLPVGGVLSPPPFSQTAGALGTGRGERRLARGRRGPQGGPSIPADAGGHLGAPRPAPRSLCEAQPHRPASSPGAVLGRHGSPDGWKNRAPRMRGAPGRRGGQPSTERFVSITVWFCGTIGNVSSATSSQSPRPLFEVGVEPGVPSGWRRLTPRTLTFAGLVDVVISHVQLRLPVDTGHACGPRVSSRRLLSVTVIVCA